MKKSAKAAASQIFDPASVMKPARLPSNFKLTTSVNLLKRNPGVSVVGLSNELYFTHAKISKPMSVDEIVVSLNSMARVVLALSLISYQKSEFASSFGG